MEAEQATQPQMILPNAVVTRVDVGRLSDEIESIDNFLREAAVRQPGTQVQLPKVSRVFDEIVAVNKLNLLQEADRLRLRTFIQKLRSEAPTLHISFGTDPSALFLQRLVTWIRQNMDTSILLQIGLQPNIGAGCVVRSTNKFYDFSLRQRFTDQRDLLTAKLRGTPETAPAQEPAPVAAQPASPAPPAEAVVS